jgi:hypothetical protein
MERKIGRFIHETRKTTGLLHTAVADLPTSVKRLLVAVSGPADAVLEGRVSKADTARGLKALAAGK